MRVVLMGPPGAGKGTQAKRLVENLGLAHLSSGDIFRSEKSSGTELGARLAGYMNAGKLVPDDIVVQVMASAVMRNSSGAGLLLDGFPRTVPQAEALDRQLAAAGKPLDAVLVINASADLIVDRITGRRSCPACGAVYHVRNMPPVKKAGFCDACGKALTQRADDNEVVVRNRLEAYAKQTRPVLDYYRAAGVRVVEVDGNRPADEVSAEMVKDIRRLSAGC